MKVEVVAEGVIEIEWERCRTHWNQFNVWEVGITTLGEISYDNPTLWDGILGLIRDEIVAQTEIALSSPVYVVNAESMPRDVPTASLGDWQ